MARYAPSDVQTEVIDNGFHPENGYLVITVVSLIVGIMLAVQPMMSLAIVCFVIGASFIVGGVFAIRRANLQREQGIPSSMMLGLGVFALLTGFFFIAGRNFIIGAIPLFFGIAFLIDGIFKLMGSFDLRNSQMERWNTVSISAVITIIIAIIVIINPIGTGALFTRLLGILLIVNGVSSLWYLFVAKDKPSKLKR